jgi:hypothetical protein
VSAPKLGAAWLVALDPQEEPMQEAMLVFWAPRRGTWQSFAVIGAGTLFWFVVDVVKRRWRNR